MLLLFFFVVVVLQFHQWLWCGVSIALNNLFFWGGGGGRVKGHTPPPPPPRGTPAIDTHGKGCNKSLNIKLLDSFEYSVG